MCRGKVLLHMSDTVWLDRCQVRVRQPTLAKFVCTFVLVDDKDFFDVTIACDDEQLQVHKVIISACSPFFRNILRRSPDQHPLLFLKVVKYNVLYVHHGEVNIARLLYCISRRPQGEGSYSNTVRKTPENTKP